MKFRMTYPSLGLAPQYGQAPAWASSFRGSVGTEFLWFVDQRWHSGQLGSPRFCGPGRLMPPPQRIGVHQAPSVFGWSATWVMPSRSARRRVMGSAIDVSPCVDGPRLEMQALVGVVVEVEAEHLASGLLVFVDRPAVFAGVEGG